MKKSRPTVICMLLLVLSLTGCASAGMFDWAIPNKAPRAAYDFIDCTNAPATGPFGYRSLRDTKGIQSEIEIVHANNKLRYYAAKELTAQAVEEGEKLENALFNKDTGYISMGLSALSGLGVGGLLSIGSYRKGLKTVGPDQVSKNEHENQKKMAGMMDPEDFKNAI